MKADKMDYTQFTTHLKQKGVQYSEKQGVDIDYWFTCYTEVIPQNSEIKARYFDNDGGRQLKTT